DVELGGQVILAVADRNPGAARAAAADLANAMWRWRHRFRSTLPSIDEALDAVLRSPEARPFVLGDQGDRVLAGAPGDGNAILRRVLERGLDLRMAVPVTDPEAVSVTRSAGVGAEITLSIGGKLTPGFEPLTVTVRVVHLSDGHFVMRGPFLAGQESALGETAVVEIGRVKVMLTSTGGFTQDVAAFTSQGIDPAQQDVIVSKSGHHFKLSFAGIATPLVVGSPGLARYTQGAFPFVRRRPVWPEDAIDLPEVVPALFGRVVTMPAGGTPPLRRLSQAQGSST
ncbi:MAG TPA: MlrC C-terminal domain-containing protein, partial [Alphaproteobacteria bacterium]|nr:MlrC C-terminal domain-containing protein [Alphaproteobacteria bacterium]